MNRQYRNAQARCIQIITANYVGDIDQVAVTTDGVAAAAAAAADATAATADATAAAATADATAAAATADATAAAADATAAAATADATAAAATADATAAAATAATAAAATADAAAAATADAAAAAAASTRRCFNACRILLNAVNVVVSPQKHNAVVRNQCICVALQVGRQPRLEVGAGLHSAVEPDHKTTSTLLRIMQLASATMLLVTDYRTKMTSPTPLQIMQLASTMMLVVGDYITTIV